MFVEANAHVTHVLSLAVQAARQLSVGLLDALDVVALDGDDTDPAVEVKPIATPDTPGPTTSTTTAPLSW